MVLPQADGLSLNSIPSFVKEHHGSHKTYVPVSTLIEWTSSRYSSHVYVYDLATAVGFGKLTEKWALENKGIHVIPSQSRSGAGLSIAGRLSGGSSDDTSLKSILTTYTTPIGLSQMAHALSILPVPTTSGRLVLQVPNVSVVGEALTLSPSLGHISASLASLPESILVILSSTPQEALNIASLSYRISDYHVIHIFDHHSSTRENHHVVVPSENADDKVTFEDALKDEGYGFFDYAGDNDAETVVVLLNSPLAGAALKLATQFPGLGVVSVRVLKPWSADALLAILPKTVRHVHVLDEVLAETFGGSLYPEVFSSFWGAEERIQPDIHEHRVAPARLRQLLSHPSTLTELLAGFAPVQPKVSPTLDEALVKKLLFFSSPASHLSSLPLLITKTFTNSRTIETRHLIDFDAYSKPGGIAADRVTIAPHSDVHNPVALPILLPITDESLGYSDCLVILDQSLLKTHSVLEHVKAKKPVLILTSWTPEEILSNLPKQSLELLLSRSSRVYIVDPKAVASSLSGSNPSNALDLEVVVAYLGFSRLYFGSGASQTLLKTLAQNVFGDSVGGVALEELVSKSWDSLAEVPIPGEGDSLFTNASDSNELKGFEFNSITPPENAPAQSVQASVESWHIAAKHLLFPEAYAPIAQNPEKAEEYSQQAELRPEVPERTFLVTCTVNRRLTPLEYDRNVFHLEFDTSNTGLKYAIGEALGVHGWNDDEDVLDFCRWYGVDPNQIITLPLAEGGGKVMHSRTVFQALQQQIDIFGKPPKSFYAALAEHSTSREDRMALLFIAAPEGAGTFKKLSETETVTFADVLQRFKSARPDIAKLCELVGDIKPRHYSIASAQDAVGDRVDLLVVTVDWVLPSGSPRYGQCTRYLAGLKVGQKVTVSIKPSVMKLPPSHEQPIIMAGLGTGAAPFRAFMQYRAWLSAQGTPVGPLLYYFGSRHRSEEYLYGEEIEAYITDGVITHAGLAFSRDGKKKVYIQHKMREDAESLVKMLAKDRGVFYLCGPTWPVPDVFEALVGALVEYQGKTVEEAGEYLESLKEEERYVLEVY
ncbi:assimilatory sulfite reductase [Sistotremastrum niveocremeum HHB9708]|uniref:assimilatory sulfite reductase (NADPH) n=1 Tax=Sistotremastrum niveocremeum HHB9708 TaxID=1314777 RepID=A0A164ZDH0_9AGAM|nr:assimilatory sulfite reductase [Sistotremastrum niveocremeum HHB9708]